MVLCQFPLKKEYIVYWICIAWLPKSTENQWEGRRGEGFFLLCFFRNISPCTSFLPLSLQCMKTTRMILTHKFPEYSSQESYIWKKKDWLHRNFLQRNVAGSHTPGVTLWTQGKNSELKIILKNVLSALFLKFRRFGLYLRKSRTVGIDVFRLVSIT